MSLFSSLLFIASFVCAVIATVMGFGRIFAVAFAQEAYFAGVTDVSPFELEMVTPGFRRVAITGYVLAGLFYAYLLGVAWLGFPVPAVLALFA